MQAHAEKTASIALTAGFMRSLRIALAMRIMRITQITQTLWITQILRFAMVTKNCKGYRNHINCGDFRYNYGYKNDMLKVRYA